METAPRDVLPLKTLRLYESGVGYFERSGELSSSSTMTLPVPSGHLDDALKTLVVLSKNGSVQAVEFPSNVGRAMARALAGLPKDADTPIAYKDLLASMKGAKVSVHTTRSSEIRGRVIDVVADDAKKADETKASDDTYTLLLLAESGAIQRVHTTDIVTIKPLDPALTVKLDAALDALSPRGAQDRALEVLAHAKGPITLGYIAETPVYRTTYRLVLDDDAKGKGVLQGWALIHNDTDENWQKVKVELVNGRPDSFLFPLAAPRYGRRELATPDETLSTVPQLLDQTADGLWGDNVDEIGLGTIGTIGHGEGGGSGFGSGSGRLSGSHVSKAPSIRESSELTVGNLADTGESTGVESGALFVYSLGEPLDLHAHSSALLPFVRRTIKVDEISWIGGNDAEPRAAAKLVNDSTQTLPAGPISFFARGGFSGESLLDRLKPGEQRFVQYGADLDLAVERKNVVAVEQPKRVSYANGELREDYLQTTDWTYELENRSGHMKNVEARLAIVSNASVTGADKIDFDTESGKPVAVFAIPQGKKIARPMHVIEGLARSTEANQLKASDLAKLAAELGPAGTQLLEVAHKQKELETTNDQIAKTKKLADGAEKDLARWRENLKAAGGDKAAGAPATLVQRVVQLEDKLEKLQASLEQLDAELTARTAAVHAALEKLPTS